MVHKRGKLGDEYHVSRVMYNEQALKTGAKQLKSDPDYMVNMIEVAPHMAKHASAPLIQDTNFAIKAVGKNFSALKHFPRKVRSNRRILEAAVEQNTDALQFASSELRGHKEFVHKAVSIDGMSLRHARNDMKDNDMLVWAAVEQNPLAIQYASKRLKADREIARKAVSLNGMAMQYISRDLREDEELCWLATKSTKEAKVWCEAGKYANIVNRVSVMMHKKSLEDEMSGSRDVESRPSSASTAHRTRTRERREPTRPMSSQFSSKFAKDSPKVNPYVAWRVAMAEQADVDETASWGVGASVYPDGKPSGFTLQHESKDPQRSTFSRQGGRRAALISAPDLDDRMQHLRSMEEDMEERIWCGSAGKPRLPAHAQNAGNPNNDPRMEGWKIPEIRVSATIGTTPDGVSESSNSELTAVGTSNAQLRSSMSSSGQEVSLQPRSEQESLTPRSTTASRPSSVTGTRPKADVVGGSGRPSSASTPLIPRPNTQPLKTQLPSQPAIDENSANRRRTYAPGSFLPLPVASRSTSKAAEKGTTSPSNVTQQDTHDTNVAESTGQTNTNPLVDAESLSASRPGSRHRQRASMPGGIGVSYNELAGSLPDNAAAKTEVYEVGLPLAVRRFSRHTS